jgi:vacuolar-type H+-ATPase subunit E/Vma4
MREGEIAGRNRAGAEMQPVIERLTRSIQEIANLRARLRREAEADVVQLALAIARRVIRREVAADPDALRGLVLAALEKLQGQEISRVKVHPAHAAVVKAGLQQAVSGGVVEVLSDSSRELGSVIFETTRGNLDASVETQLHRNRARPYRPFTQTIMTDRISLAPYIAGLDATPSFRWTGQVTEVIGLLVESRGPNVAIGDFCEVRTSSGRRIRAQVIGFHNGRVLSMPLEEIDGLQLGRHGGGA